MKYPKKPKEPIKPEIPYKYIERENNHATLYVSEVQFNIKSFEELIKEKFPDTKLEDINFSFMAESNYYDDDNMSIIISAYTTSLIDNPRFNSLLKLYNKNLDKYNKDIQKYKEDIKKFEFHKKEYDKELLQRKLQKAKSLVSKLESTIKKQ